MKNMQKKMFEKEIQHLFLLLKINLSEKYLDKLFYLNW
ncbi:hypothetical protein RV12_GL002875 [Enterococcus quebecensis]|nr:hypothetical protein RV12_GL002875 [Enterococcus quebecensis]